MSSLKSPASQSNNFSILVTNVVTTLLKSSPFPAISFKVVLSTAVYVTPFNSPVVPTVTQSLALIVIPLSSK